MVTITHWVRRRWRRNDAVLFSIGLPTTLNYLAGFLPSALLTAVENLSFQTHFESMQKGIVDFRTRSILGKLNQPVSVRLYYAKTAALKAPDAIRHYNDYYYFVRSILEEYAAASKGMINLQVIDPRPFSDEEQEVLRYGSKKFGITVEERLKLHRLLKRHSPIGGKIKQSGR